FSVIGQTPDRYAQSELASENRRLPPQRANVFRRRRRGPYRWAQWPSRLVESSRLQARATVSHRFGLPQRTRRSQRLEKPPSAPIYSDFDGGLKLARFPWRSLLLS